MCHHPTMHRLGLSTGIMGITSMAAMVTDMEGIRMAIDMAGIMVMGIEAMTGAEAS